MTQQYRVSVLFLTLLIAFAFVLAIVTAAAGNPQTLFTDNITSTGPITAVTVMEQELLDRINGATTSIDAAFYDFNRVSIRDALIAAHNRGVVVRVVTDDEAYADAGYGPHFAALEAAGITVINDGRSSIMHNKFAVIDGEVVWTGSTNWSDNGFTYNHNNSVVFTSTELADIYGAEFDEMFVDGHFGTAKTDNTSHTLTYNGVPLEIYFSPTDNAMDEVIAEVNAATESIQFSIFFFTDDALRDAIIGRMQAGVTVSGVWDNLGAANQYSDDETLCAAGANIKIEDFGGKMHNKFMVIDADGANPVVVTGSMNWSSSGDEANDENTLIIHDGPTAQAYLAAFQALYAALDLDTLCNPQRVYLPIVTSPNPNVLNISGYIREGSSSGAGLSGVDIYQAIATYGGVLVATTDANGYYEVSPLDTQGQQATIRLWAEKDGYTFDPVEYLWVYYGDSSTVSRDFVATAVTVAPADVQITSIVYNPDGDDVQGEYVRIENAGGTAQTMTNWVLVDDANHSFTFPLFELQPGAAVQVWTKSGSNTGSDLFWGSGSAIWNNTGDTAFLRDDSGTIVDTCSYAGGGTSASCSN